MSACADSLVKGQMNLLTSITTRLWMVAGWIGSWATFGETFLELVVRENLIRLTPDATRVKVPGGWIGKLGRLRGWRREAGWRRWPYLGIDAGLSRRAPFPID
jgi:hypothetical protein